MTSLFTENTASDTVSIDDPDKPSQTVTVKESMRRAKIIEENKKLVDENMDVLRMIGND